MVKLNPPIATSILDFQIAPGAAYVMFIAKATGASADELYEIDTPGLFGAQKRSRALDPGENVLAFQISPTAAQVAYTVGANNLGLHGNLWRVSFNGGVSELLTEAADPGHGVYGSEFSFTPDGQRVVFIYQKGAAAPRKLPSARADGSPPDRLDLFVPDSGHNLYGVDISRNSQWVLFEDENPSALDVILRGVPTISGNPVLFGAGDQPQISPDSQRVVWVYVPPSRDYSDLLSLQIFGGGQRNLTRMPGREYAYDPRFSPDGNWIVFLAELDSSSGTTIGSQLRVSDGTEAPQVFSTYLPLMQK